MTNKRNKYTTQHYCFFKNEILWNNLYIFFKLCQLLAVYVQWKPTIERARTEKSIFKTVKICFCPDCSENKTKEVNKTYSKWFLKSISRIFLFENLKKIPTIILVIPKVSSDSTIWELCKSVFGMFGIKKMIKIELRTYVLHLNTMG